MANATSVSWSGASTTGQPATQGMMQADGFFSPVTVGTPTGTDGIPSKGPAQFPYGVITSGTYRSTAIQTANANVVPANITGLSAAVAVGTYAFEAVLKTTVASGTAGIAINQVLTTAVLNPCNFQAVGFMAAAVATQATTTATSGTVLFTLADQPLEIIIKGSFTVTTAGTFGLQMCQAVSNASNSSVNVGSTMTLNRIS